MMLSTNHLWPLKSSPAHVFQQVIDGGIRNVDLDRSMWGRLKKIEQRMGKPLLIRQKGGASGGQSILTPEAKVMVDRFKQLQKRLNDMSENVFKDIYSG